MNGSDTFSLLAQACAVHAIAQVDQPTEDPVRQAWNDRLREYMRRRALCEAEISFGSYAAVQLAHDNTCSELEIKYGNAYRTIPEAAALWAPSWQRLAEAEEARVANFDEPMWSAARALALTPAPDVAAATLKVEIIKTDEVWNDSGLGIDAAELVKLL